MPNLEWRRALPKLIWEERVALAQLTTKPHYLQWAAPHFHPKMLPPLRQSSPRPSLDRPHSPPQTTTRSSRPFCHSTHSRQTDGPTDGIDDKSVRRALKLRCIDSERRAKTDCVYVGLRRSHVSMASASSQQTHGDGVRYHLHSGLNHACARHIVYTCSHCGQRSLDTTGSGR